MEDGNWIRWFVVHWYVWLALACVGIGIAIGKSAGPTPNEVVERPDVPSTQLDLRNTLNERLSERSAKEADTEKPSTDTVIREHEARLKVLEQTPVPEESAALLSALGNLHKQKKRDPATAARYFEELIQNYPEWPGINGAYHQLIACYTQLDEPENLRLLYRKMVTVFPEESNEYEYANAALKGSL